MLYGILFLLKYPEIPTKRRSAARLERKSFFLSGKSAGTKKDWERKADIAAQTDSKDNIQTKITKFANLWRVTDKEK